MIASRLEIKTLLQIPVERVSSGALIAGQRYEVVSGTTGDFSNIGGTIVVGSIFTCIAAAPAPPATEPVTTPTDWGDVVLAEYEDADDLIETLIPKKSKEIFGFCHNTFIHGEAIAKHISIANKVLTGEGVEALKYGNIRIESEKPISGNYTVETIAAGSLTIKENIFDESDIDVILYNVIYPEELKEALAYMIADDLNKDTLANTKSETIGRINRNKGGDASFPYSDYVRSILWEYTRSEAQ